MQTATRNMLIGGGTMFFALFMLFILIPMQVSVPSSVTIATTAPDYWPRCISWMLLCLGALQVLVALPHLRDCVKKDAEPEADEKSGRTKALRLTLVALLFAWYFLIAPLGLPVATALALPAAAWLYGERSPLALLACALIPSSFLYWFFVTVAQASIDPGILVIFGF